MEEEGQLVSTVPQGYEFDEEALTAAIDLVGRTGAKDVTFGYLDDDVPIQDARWWAKVMYGERSPVGVATVMTEDHVGPVEAMEALAHRLLDGGQCQFCGRKVALSEYRNNRCRWRRVGDTWHPGCRKVET